MIFNKTENLFMLLRKVWDNFCRQVCEKWHMAYDADPRQYL